MPPDELPDDAFLPLDELLDEPLNPSVLLLSCDRPCDAERPERCPSPCDDELRSRFWSLFWSPDDPLREFVFPWFAILYLPSWTFAGGDRPARPGAPPTLMFRIRGARASRAQARGATSAIAPRYPSASRVRPTSPVR